MDYLWRWIRGSLEFLLPFLRAKNCTLVFLGLKNAGKTTLMGRLKEGRMIQASPTLHPHNETLTMGNLTFTAYDLGGHEQVLKVWSTYTVLADGIVYMVDASDRNCMMQSRAELDNLLSDESIANVPLAVLLNKIDVHGAVGEAEVECLFQLQDMRSGKGKVKIEGRRPLEIFSCSVLQEQGYGEAFRWLSGVIKASE